MTFSFQLADKHNFESIIPEVFKILRTNTELIFPTGYEYEEDFAVWREYIVPAMQDDQRQIVLMFCDGGLAGYFQYSINADSLMMEEIQIKAGYQGTGLFRELYHWLKKKLPEGIVRVEAYTNKNNEKSQKILEHLGLDRAGENRSGSSFYYSGKLGDLWKSFR